ncbi:Tol-Pal system protein TolQ [hydrothermal vent metagenome]|uniref:Tol-Pal system protein TolQ n=1 Tax=hydrothermal vent metagenome TaxID=652676 RepID=A0A3B0VNW7_9ZZZZ
MSSIVAHGRIWDMVAAAGPMVKLVLLLLVFLSIVSWAIILYKIILLKKIEKDSSAYYDLFWQKKDLSHMISVAGKFPSTPMTKLTKGAHDEAAPLIGRLRAGQDGYVVEEGLDYIERVLKKTITMERAAMEKTTPFLATTGSTAPFIGLFGTVWGIMNTFRAIGSQGAANLAVVAPGISEALIATALGLIAAIPAVVGYNYIITRTERITKEMEAFSSDLTNILEKSLRHASRKQ